MFGMSAFEFDPRSTTGSGSPPKVVRCVTSFGPTLGLISVKKTTTNSSATTQLEDVAFTSLMRLHVASLRPTDCCRLSELTRLRIWDIRCTKRYGSF